MTEHLSSREAQSAQSTQSTQSNMGAAESTPSRWLYGAIILAVVMRPNGLASISLRGDEIVSQFYAQLPLSDLVEILRTF